MSGPIDINSILQSLASIFSVFKPREAIIEEKAEHRDIKNKVFQKKAEVRIIKLNKRINKLNKKDK